MGESRLVNPTGRGEIRNPKLEARNKFKIQEINTGNSIVAPVSSIAPLNFGFVSGFGFRISEPKSPWHGVTRSCAHLTLKSLKP
jgi:hypothetical protein